MEFLASKIATSRSSIRELVLVNNDNVIYIAKILTSFKNLLLYL